jgi:hypothetical protein
VALKARSESLGISGHAAHREGNPQAALSLGTIRSRAYSPCHLDPYDSNTRFKLKAKDHMRARREVP